MTTGKSDGSHRRITRRDPRAEPDSPLPAGVVEEVAPSVKRDPRADPDTVPPTPAIAATEVVAKVHPEPVPVPVPESPRESGTGTGTGTGPNSATTHTAAPAPVDPRFAELEPLVARNAWKEIAERLGAAGEAGALPPALALVFALAQREAAGEEGAAGATALAIRSMAALVGVPQESGMALVLAKRLLRRNPAGWRQRPAPAARYSAVIIVLGILVGAAVGWFANFGSIRLF